MTLPQIGTILWPAPSENQTPLPGWWMESLAKIPGRYWPFPKESGQPSLSPLSGGWTLVGGVPEGAARTSEERAMIRGDWDAWLKQMGMPTGHYGQFMINPTTGEYKLMNVPAGKTAVQAYHDLIDPTHPSGQSYIFGDVQKLDSPSTKYEEYLKSFYGDKPPVAPTTSVGSAQVAPTAPTTSGVNSGLGISPKPLGNIATVKTEMPRTSVATPDQTAVGFSGFQFPMYIPPTSAIRTPGLRSSPAFGPIMTGSTDIRIMEKPSFRLPSYYGSMGIYGGPYSSSRRRSIV